jgi:hypothetical protein
MAVVHNPLLSQEAHGKIGGTEFRLIHGRAVVGRTSLATPRRTLHTNSARLGFDHAVKAWRDLSDADRALWCQEAGSASLGFQLWTQRACITLSAAQSLPSVQSDPRPNAYIELYSVSASSGPPPTLSVTWDTYGCSMTTLLWYWQPQQRTSPNPSKWRWLLLGTSPGDDNIADLDTPYYAASFHLMARLVSRYSGQVYHEYLRAELT